MERMNGIILGLTKCFHHCHLCAKAYSSDKSLAKHLRKKHTSGTEAQCSIRASAPGDSQCNTGIQQQDQAAQQLDFSASASQVDKSAKALVTCPECNTLLHGEKDCKMHFSYFHNTLYLAWKTGCFGESTSLTAITPEMVKAFYSDNEKKQITNASEGSPNTRMLDISSSSVEIIDELSDCQLAKVPHNHADCTHRQRLDRADRLFSRFRGKRSKLKTQLANTAPFFLNKNGAFEFNTNEDPQDINCPFCITHKTTIKGLAKHCVNHHIQSYNDWKSGKFGSVQLRFVPPDSKAAASVLQVLDEAKLLNEIPLAPFDSSLSPERQIPFPSTLSQQASFESKPRAHEACGNPALAISLPCPFCRKRIRAKGITSHCSFYHRQEYRDWKDGKFGQIPLYSIKFPLSKWQQKYKKRHQNLQKFKATVASSNKVQEATPCPFCGEYIFSKGMGKHCISSHKTQYNEWKLGNFGRIPLRFVPSQVGATSDLSKTTGEKSKDGDFQDATVSPSMPLYSMAVAQQIHLSGSVGLSTKHAVNLSSQEPPGTIATTNQQNSTTSRVSSPDDVPSSSLLHDTGFCQLSEKALGGHFTGDGLEGQFHSNPVPDSENSTHASDQQIVSYYVCNICRAPYPSRRSLSQHYRIHKFDSSCAHSVPGVAHLESLRCKKFTIIDAKISPTSISHALNETEPIVSNKYRCGTCFAEFPSTRSLAQHSRIHNGCSSSSQKRSITYSDKVSTSMTYSQQSSLALDILQTAGSSSEHSLQGTLNRMDGRSYMECGNEAEPSGVLNCCPKCWLIFPKNNDLKRHIAACVVSAYNTSASDGHLSDRSSSEKAPNICPQCNQVFDNGTSLQYHMPFCVAANSTEQVCGLFTCFFCSRRFMDESAAKLHMMTCRNNRYQSQNQLNRLPDAVDLLKEIEDARKINECLEEVYRCRYCSLAFNNVSLIRDHEKYCRIGVHSVLSHVCHQCSQNFTSEDQLLSHIVGAHAAQMQSSPYPKASQLAKSQSHQCKVCGKVFSSPANLLKHNVVHTSARVGCQHCKRQFRMPCHLARHYCHSPEAPRPPVQMLPDESRAAAVLLFEDDEDVVHECGLCTAVFQDAELLRLHSTSCRQRAQEFAGDRVNLVDTGHGLQALAAGKLRCGRCPMQFDSRASLSLHLRSHSAVKGPAAGHQCDMCGRVFNLAMHLGNHRLACALSCGLPLPGLNQAAKQ